jgi:hypothetical protein
LFLHLNLPPHRAGGAYRGENTRKPPRMSGEKQVR